MLDGLNKYGLPVKYGVLCALGGVVATFLANTYGYSQGGSSYLSSAIAAGVGGAVGGWIRQFKGKKS